MANAASRCCVLFLAASLGGCATVHSAFSEVWGDTRSASAPAAAPAAPAAAPDKDDQETQTESRWTWPWAMFWPRQEAEAAADRITIITDAGSDARPEAAAECARDHRVAHLTSAERQAGATDKDEKIVWHFECVD